MPARGKKTVVIAGADYLTGLGTARALRRLGLQIIGLCADPKQPCARSRVWTRLVTVDGTPDGHVEKLIELGGAMADRSVLFPSQDQVVQAVSDHREELGKYYDFVLPEKPVLDSMMKKTAFHQWATEHGFAVPESHSAISHKELTGILDTMGYPVIIKPALQTQSWRMLSPVDKVLKLNCKACLSEIGFDLFEAAPEILVQQWISGGDGDVHFCLAYYDREGHESGHYTVRKLIQWPLTTGTAAAAVGSFNENVHRLTQEVFREAGYRGLGSLEVKQSARDKEYYIVEATVGRNDLNSPIAAAGGVNLTLMAYYDAIGSDRVLAVRPRKATWINEYSLPAAIRRSDNFKFRQIFKLFGRRMSFAYFSLTDPMPFFHLCKRTLSRKLKKLTRRSMKTADART